MKIIWPRASEIPPVLSRNRSHAHRPPTLTSPTRGEANDCACRAKSRVVLATQSALARPQAIAPLTKGGHGG